MHKKRACEHLYGTIGALVTFLEVFLFRWGSVTLQLRCYVQRALSDMGVSVVNAQTVLIGGLATIRLSREQLAAQMVADCVATRKQPSKLPQLVFSSNGQGISLVGSDTVFAEAMAAANIIHADGMSVVIASRVLTRRPLPERIATTDFIHDASVAAVKSDLSFFLLGGTETQSSKAYLALQRQYPQLRIVGRRNGERIGTDDEALCEEIRRSRADVLWVALGKPKQELWCVQNRERLAGVGWIKTCGGLFAFLSNEVPRAPVWMQNAGLEWLHRTMQDPSRLLWRYLMTNPHAIYRMIRFSY
jgi:N-acetylglucosaminyldiphosphoundecaprenol N-acetyl-beta-D-mannosaminyltransferase